MKKAVQLLLVITALALLGGGLASAQNDLPPLAAITNEQLTLYGFGGGPRVIAPEGGSPFTSLTWSPDGQHLAFLTYGDGGGWRLLLTDSGGSAPVTLAQSVMYMPPTFSADSARVIYVAESAPDTITQGGDGIPRMPVRVVSQELRPDAPTELLGTFNFGVGCGGGSPFPMDAIYNMEAGFGGRGLTLVRTDFGILHSLDCAGGGLGLLNPETGESATLAADVSRARLSPDGRQVAAVQGGSLVIIDLASQGSRTVGVSAAPDQIAWGDSSTVFYSVRTLIGAPLPLSGEEAQALAANIGLSASDIPQYNVAIHRVDLNSGQDTPVYNGPGWAVGRVFASRGSLYFSVIPNGEGWAEAIASGEINFADPRSYIQEQRAVSVTLLRMPLGGGNAVEVASGIGRATLHPSGR